MKKKLHEVNAQDLSPLLLRRLGCLRRSEGLGLGFYFHFRRLLLGLFFRWKEEKHQRVERFVVTFRSQCSGENNGAQGFAS